MKRSKEELEQLISNPSESLDTETKQWIDPKTNHGRALIVRGCMALRNNDGGYLIIGIKNDGTLDPNPPLSPRKLFHADVIQRLVGEYAAPTFDIEVEFAESNGVEYPIIFVPNGVVSPIVSKKEIANPNDKYKPFLKADTVYVRTTLSTFTVSSAPAKAADFDRLTRFCFNNREADIGAFVRRHLSAVDLDALSRLIAPTPPRTAAQRAADFLEVGRQSFNAKRTRENLTLPHTGTFEVAIVIDGEFQQAEANKDFYRRLQLNKPRHSGWSFFIGDYSLSHDDPAYPMNNAWESLTGAPGRSGDFDFWRAETSGRFIISEDCETIALRNKTYRQDGFSTTQYTLRT